MTNDFTDWSNGAPVDFGSFSFSFDDWHDGAPVPLYTATGSYSLSAAVGSFSLGGQSANLVIGVSLSASAGSFALSGQDAGFALGVSLGAGVGGFNLDGQTVTLTYSGTPTPPTPPNPGPMPGGGGSTGPARWRRITHRPREREAAPKKKDHTPEPSKPIRPRETILAHRYIAAGTGFVATTGRAAQIAEYRLPSEDEDLATVLLMEDFN